MLIATFRCAAPARCGAFADERRIVAGDEGGDVDADAKRASVRSGVQLRFWRTRFSRSSGRQRRRGSRRSIRFARLELERITPLHTGALIATFRCAAPARCGAFADERRIVAGDEGGYGLRMR